MKKQSIRVPATISVAVILLTLLFMVATYKGYGSNNETASNATTTSDISNTTLEDERKSNLVSNPDFASLLSYWNDSEKICGTTFRCISNSTTGWTDNSSLQLSTRNNTNNTWSWITGSEIDVKPRIYYNLVSHMKVNKWATGSHIVLEGFNETSKQWYQIIQCPSGINGPLKWTEFSCVTQIPDNTTKIRPVLNAGWAYQQNREAVTLFDAINITRVSELANLSSMPIVHDPRLKVELVSEGLKSPTSMAFLGPDDILVLEKVKGTVQRIVNGNMLPEPVLDANVINNDERGMLGIAVAGNGSIMNSSGSATAGTYVFLYYTESPPSGGDLDHGNNTLGNRLYRYELAGNGTRLVNPRLLLDLPAIPGPAHNGGVVTIGPDNNLYIVIGDIAKICWFGCKNPTQKDLSPDGSSGILRVTQDGQTVKGILGDKQPIDKYYAYGIRNSFGIDFDPLTGKVWDTENGEGYGDEINLVEPGFNSGHPVVQGIWAGDDEKTIEEKKGNLSPEEPNNLEDFGGKGKYSDPEFEWRQTVGPTAIVFLNSDKLGKQYDNDMFVGDFHNGNIYHFDLNKNRTGLVLEGPLADKVGDTLRENKEITFGEGFHGITDLKVGPDGYLYVVSHIDGKIYRIVPKA